MPTTQGLAPRTRVLTMWEQSPGFMLYLENAGGSPYRNIMSGLIDVHQREIDAAERIIRSDREAFPNVAALRWEATQVQNGLHRPVRAGALTPLEYRVRTARHGSASVVVGRRIVQVFLNGEWKSFGFITRAGNLRLWASHQHEALAPYVRVAQRYFDGTRCVAETQQCWFCNDNAHSSGLCIDHLGHVVAERSRITDEPIYEDHDVFSLDDDEETGDPLVPLVPPSWTARERSNVPRTRTSTRAPRSLVRACRSPLHPEFWQ